MNKINEIINLLAEEIEDSDKEKQVLMLEVLYLLLSNDEFAKYVQEKL